MLPSILGRQCKIEVAQAKSSIKNPLVVSPMSSFKVNISLEASFTSQELADFFSALAQSEKGNVQPLVRILHPIAEPPPPPTPIPAEAEEAEAETETETAPETPSQPVPEPAVTDAVKRTLMNTEISCERLNSIIRRHNWSRGQKARIERKWGFSKASCFARIGFHFGDYSLMNGQVSTEDQLLQWVRAKGFQGAF